MVGAFLEADLQRIVIGFRGQASEATKGTIKLRKRPQQINQRNGVIVVNRSGLVENGIGSGEKRLERIGNLHVKAIGRAKAKAIAVRFVTVDDLLANGRWQEIAIGRTRKRAEW